MFFNPFGFLFFFLFFLSIIFVIAFIHIGLITIAFERLGLSESQAFGFLILSLLGSSVNIPIKKIEIPSFEPMAEKVRFFGMIYNVPKKLNNQMVIAINLGGAIVPFVLSCYLMWRNGLFGEPIVAALAVAGLTYFFAKPVPGVGIAMPMLIPPLIAAIVVFILGPARHGPAIAYVAATMGTLLGADIFHLKDIKRIQAPLVSIGGAGTFDGIFLAGIIAVLLA